MGVSNKETFWQGVIDAYYEKYYGVAAWHKAIVKEAQLKKRLEIPSGRYYPFELEKNKYGSYKWPITKIKNYPVQGFGADLVMLARIESRRRLRDLSVDFVSTVHDSIVVDCEESKLDEVAKRLLLSVQEVPRLCKTEFDYDFNLPLTAEVQYGHNKRDMQEYIFN
jgi:DNA polymerase I-like protein with 3'-5' exonuclease and polymerase domains